MVLSMLIFGGPTLHYFALALTIGILFGIYSSVFVAAGIAMWLGVKREDLVKARPRTHIPTWRPARIPPRLRRRRGACTRRSWSRAWRRWCRSIAKTPAACSTSPANTRLRSAGATSGPRA
jgi:hypothetical protein